MIFNATSLFVDFHDQEVICINRFYYIVFVPLFEFRTLAIKKLITTLKKRNYFPFICVRVKVEFFLLRFIKVLGRYLNSNIHYL